MTEPDEPPAAEAKAAEAPNPVLSAACPEPSRGAEGIRTFSLNSPEAHQALCRPEERPWIEAGSLPRVPRGRPGVVEREGGPFPSSSGTCRARTGAAHGRVRYALI